jgi:hypothetical protein
MLGPGSIVTGQARESDCFEVQVLFRRSCNRRLDRKIFSRQCESFTPLFRYN